MLFSNLSYQLCEQDIDMKMVLTNLDKLSSVYIRQPESTSWGAISRLLMHPEDHFNSISGGTFDDRRLAVLLRAATLVGKLNLTKLVVEEPRECQDHGLVSEHYTLSGAKVARIVTLCTNLDFSWKSQTNTSFSLAHHWLTWHIWIFQLADIRLASTTLLALISILDIRPHLMANVVRSLPQLKSLSSGSLKASTSE